MKTVCKKLLSLMLVAILLVSAVPFQASAAAGDACTLTVYWYDGNTYVGQNGGNRVVGESFDVDAYVKSLYDPGYAYTITSRTQNGAAVGSTVTYVDGANEIKVFTAKTNAVLTLDAGTNGGTINGNSSANRDVTYNVAVGDLPNAVKANNTFLGWFENADGTGHQLQSNEAWLVNGNKTYYACFRENRNALTISAVKIVDGVQKDSYTLFSDSVMENQLLLAYLTTNWNDDVRAAVPTGYKWDPEQWYNNAASTPLSDQTQFNDANRAVFVKFTAKSYTLSFDAAGGTVNPTSKTVYYDKAVGELPTPTCDGKVFSHWIDQYGNTVTANTIYKYDGNHKLTAVYEGEIIVNLHMHTEKSKTGGIIAPLSGYVAGDDITQTIAMNVVKKYYSGNMTFVGLFNTSDWNQYVDGKLPTGKNFIEIPDDASGTYTIHVMINNGTLGTGGSTSGSTSDGSTSGSNSNTNVDKTNPQTGDGIVLALAAMMSTGGAALVLGKKKFF